MPRLGGTPFPSTSPDSPSTSSPVILEGLWSPLEVSAWFLTTRGTMSTCSSCERVSSETGSSPNPPKCPLCSAIPLSGYET